MHEGDLLLQVLLVTAAAFIGGAHAHARRLPTIIGFLVAGMLIGPGTPGPVAGQEEVEQAADLGVILLMFGIGIEFSFRQLAQHRRLILVGGTLQVGSIMLLSFVAGLGAGLPWSEAVLLGLLVFSTSTVVVVKVLEGRGRLKSVEGIAAINVCILQDLVAVVAVIVVPSLGGGDFQAEEIVLALGKGVLLIAVAYFVSVYLLPGVWSRLAHARSRELSLLGAITLAIGFAAGSNVLGLSVAFGAFLAGLAISENEYGYTTLSDVIPLREIFASIFFVSVGMLIDPAEALDEAPTVAAILVLMVLGKSMLSAAALRYAGVPLGAAIVAGLLLAEVGEFGFVIARTGLDAGVLDPTLGAAFLVAAVLSIVLNPLLIGAAAPLLTLASRHAWLSRRLLQTTEAVSPEEIEALRRHVIVCGYGASGMALARSLTGRGLRFVVIDNNPFILDALRRSGAAVPFIYGDATRPEVLDLARVREARVLAVTIPDPGASQLAVVNARLLNAAIDVVSRGTADERQMLRQAGVNEIVDPDFEASLEFVRHVLHRFGVDAREIAALQARRRAEHYRVPPLEES